MNTVHSSSFMAALVLMLLMTGGWPLLLLVVLAIAVLFGGYVFFHQEADSNPNGYCRGLQNELAQEAEAARGNTDIKSSSTTNSFNSF